MSEFDKSSKKLNILSPEEIESLYARPNFSQAEREDYFRLKPNEVAIVSQLRGLSSKLNFILQLGYFKAKQRFFSFKMEDVKEDLDYLHASYFADEIFDWQALSSLSRRRQQQAILELCAYRACGQAERQALQLKIEELAHVDSQPVFLFRESLQYLQHQRIMLPSYTWWQDLIGQVLSRVQNRLLEIAQSQLSQDEQKQFYALLTQSEGQYPITQLKQSVRHFGNKEMAREILRTQTLAPLYEIAQRVLPHLQISNESIKYYASLVDYYSVFQLSQLRNAMPLVYLLCFVYHRYQTFQDSLIKTLLYRVNRYLDAAKTSAQAMLQEQQIAFTQNLQKAGYVLKLITDEEQFPDASALKQVRATAFSILPRADLEAVAQQLSQRQPPDETAFQWQALAP